jgi:hypothetical protein
LIFDVTFNKKGMKNLNLFIILFLSISLLALSCNKEAFSCKSNCLIFEGSVIDSYTNNVVENGTVKLYLVPSSLGGVRPIEKGKTTTDKNGNYEIRLEGINLYKKEKIGP